MPTVVVTQQKKGPGCLVQLIWFILVGSWLSLLAVALAWLLMATIVGIPLGIAIINKLPKIVALREPGEDGLLIIVAGDTTVVTTAGVTQHSFLVRAIWFVLIGLWFSGVWMSIAWLLCCTIIGMPLGFKMFDMTPTVLSLHRS